MHLVTSSASLYMYKGEQHLMRRESLYESFLNSRVLLKYNFVETPRKFIIGKLSIRKLGSSSVLMVILCDKKLTSYFHKIIF